MFAFCIAMLISFVACEKDDDYDKQGSATEALQFRVLAPDTKVTYSDLSTSFENGDVIGCVIAAKSVESYSFKTNTKWEYKNGVLMLATEVENVIKKHSTEAMADQGYVELQSDDFMYAFFFYYPYVEELDETYPNVNEWGTIKYFATELTEGNWTSYPMFVHTDYDASGNNTKTLLNRTDHMWVGYTQDQREGGDISKSNANYPVNLEFKKKTATIEIHCDIADEYEISNISVSSEKSGILRGVKLDLSTGIAVNYPSEDNSSTQAKNDLYTGNFTPGLIKTTENKEKVYRMMLPAQTISEWSLNATLNGPNIPDGPKAYSIPLQEKLSVLEEGKLYILHIAKAGHGYIIINDWTNGGASDLVEDQTMPENLSLSAVIDRGSVEGSLLVRAGDQLVVKGDNLDYATSLRFNGVYKFTEFTLADDKGSITFNLPAAAQDGDVFLVTSSGIAVSAGTFVFVKPSATEISNTSVRPGETLTITGTDLDLVTKVVFGGGATVDVNEVNAEGTSLTVTVPDMAVTGTISFMLANDSTVPCDGLGEITVAAPEVTGMSADKFKAKALVTISGSNLDLAAGVRIKWEETVKEVEYSKVDVSTLTFIMPDEALDGSVYVIARSGAEISAGSYTLTVSAVADENGYSPSVVEAGDDLVITGTDLDLVKTVTFVGSSTPVEPSAKSETTLTVKVPDGGKTGALTLTLLNGTTVTCPELTFAQPSVTSMTGTRDEVDGKPVFKAGETVTLAGENLHLIKSIKLENAEVTTLTVSDDKKTLTFEMPATAMDGTASYVSKSGDVVNIGEYVLVKPVVTSGTPVSAEPGQILELTGTDMNLVTGVKFYNNVDPSEDPTITETTITVKVPDNASTGTLNLNLANGTRVDIQLTVNKISGCSVSTAKGDSDGNGYYEVRESGTVTVSGNNLGLAKSVKIVVDGGATHTVEVTDADLSDGLSFVLPSGVTSAGTIWLVNQYGYEVQAGRYEMAFPTGVSLSSPIKAGETVTITGTDMDLVSSVMFQNNVAPVETPVISETEISVKVPDTAIEGDLSLVTKYGKPIYVSYTLVKPAWISYNPAEKAFVGKQLTINGSNMDLVTGVTFTESSTPVVPDEGTRTESSITVVVPAEAKTGQIYLNLANGKSVPCPELTIDYPWCYITDNLETMEIYSGSTIELNVANGSALTGVQVNGADVSCSWSESKLSITIPDSAGKNTTLTLVSEGKGSVEYTFNCAKVIWTGSANMNNEDIYIAASPLQKIQSGSVIILECTQSPSSYGYVSLKYKSNQQEVLAGYQFPWVGSETERTVIFTITKDISEDIYVDTAVWGGTITLNRIIIK